MRCSLVLICLCIFAGSFLARSATAQPPPTAALRAQIEELQRQLDQAARRETQDSKVTEIGSSRGRSHVEEEPRLVVRIYDLSDLYSIAPQYPAREPADLQDASRAVFPETELSAASPSGFGGMGGGGFGGGFFAVPPGKISRGGEPATLHQVTSGTSGEHLQSFRSAVESLIETITATISPDEWDAVGGPASITALGASLVVSAPADTHDKITALLDLFRKRWGALRTVSLQAHWLWLTEDELAAAPAEFPWNDKATAAYGVMSDDAWKQLREAAAARAKERSGFHLALTCYNGQTVYALAGGQKLSVVGMTPVVGGSEKEAAYQPVVRVLQEGAALQATPIATRTAKFVVVDVHSRVNLLDRAAGRPPAAGGEKAAKAGAVEQVIEALDRPPLASQRLSTTLRIPTGRPTLVGGMTFSGAGGGEANLYLFLTARVQELRDEEPKVEQGGEPDVPRENDTAIPAEKK
ncbi:MAG TPA: hypothetical protein VFV87_09625 [Pirellulaceae bacterium]|nr:hypothetical protein [Pirellulaceae bacterium]